MRSENLSATLQALAEVGTRSPLRPGFAGAVSRFLSTPGATTEDPSTFAAHPTQEVVMAASKFGKTLLQELSNKVIEDLKDTYMASEELSLDDKTALEAGLADLAAEMDAHFKTLSATAGECSCSLAGPEVLTVWSSAKGFRKESHVGGEDFMPVEAYLGKKGKIIVKLKPLQAAGYDLMEMPADQALNALVGFNILSITPEGSYEDRVHSLNVVKAKLREQARNKDKFDQYADFGTF